MWKNAELSDPCEFQPEGNGWLLESGFYQIQWFEGSQVPQSVCDILLRDEVQEDEEDDEILHGEEVFGRDESDDDGDGIGDW
jgi:hypothetical protein